MMDKKLVFAIGIFGVLAAVYYAMGKKKNLVADSVTIVTPPEVLEVEKKALIAKSYSPALLREYNLIVPPFAANLNAQVRAGQINAKRFSIDERKVKPPLFL
jgi:actin-like ATPase involved in cell morphogenesis